MINVIDKIYLGITGPLLMGLGAFSLAAKYLLDETANLPFWPVDGMLAIVGGAFVTWWSYHAIREIHEQEQEEHRGE